MTKCETCRYFERGKWHPSAVEGGGKRCGGQCKILHKVLLRENSSLWVLNAIQVQDTFGCSLWQEKGRK